MSDRTRPTEAFLRQHLHWSTAWGDRRLQYASVQVPLDHADPGGEQLTLALGRTLAARPELRRGTLVVVHGGPGGDGGLGRDLPLELAHTPLAEVYDVVGIDLRGTGASTRLEGESTPATVPFDSRPPDEVFAGLVEDMRARDAGCRRAAGGERRRHFSTRNTARDIDLVRRVLGESRIDMLGYAYGTLVVAVFGSMFPAALGRSVLDSTVHPGWDWQVQFRHQAVAIRENVDAWADWAGRRDRTFGLGRGAAAVLATVEDTASALLEVAAGSPGLRTAFDMVLGDAAAHRPGWDDLARLVGDVAAAARAGDGDTAAARLAGQRRWRPGTPAGELREAVLEAVTCETTWPTDLETYFADMRHFREHYPYGLGVMRVQPWVGAFGTFVPAEPPTVLQRDGYPAGLVVQSDGDPLDHHAGGPAMAARLGHHLVRVVDSGAHEVYGRTGHADVDRIVEAYLLRGELPAGRCTEVPGEPRPAVPEDAALPDVAAAA